MVLVLARCFLLVISSLLLVVARQPSAVGFLTSGRNHALNGRRKASQGHLRRAAASLAAALRKEFGSGAQDPAMVSAARQRLQDEAKRLHLQKALGAPLLRSYAQFAPATVLLVPAYQDMADTDDDSQAADDRAGSKSWSSSESSQTISNSQDGRETTLRTRCRDGNCVQQKTVGASKLATPQQSDLTEDQAGGMQRQSMSTSNAAQEMVDSMQAAHEAFGQDGFQDIMKDTFPFGDDIKDAFSFPHLGFDNDMKDNDFWDAAKPLHVGSGSMNSTSVETETHVDGKGHVVKKSKNCVNGKCTSNVLEKNLQPASGDKGKAGEDSSSSPTKAENGGGAIKSTPI